MNRRDFIGTLAGALAASRVSDLSNLDRIIKTLPPSASILIPAGRSFMVQRISFSNNGARPVKPRLAIGKDLVYSDLTVGPGGILHVIGYGFQGYQLEDDEPVILTGQPGTTAVLSGYMWDIPKSREEKIEPRYYSFWSSI